METGIAIFRSDPDISERSDVISERLREVHADFLAFEGDVDFNTSIEKFGAIATKLEIPKILIFTLQWGNPVSWVEKRIDLVSKHGPDQVWLRTLGTFLSIEPIVEFVTKLLNLKDLGIGYISPIGDILHETSNVRRLFGEVKKHVEYIPMTFYKTHNQDLFPYVKKLNKEWEENITTIVTPITAPPNSLVNWIKKELVPAGVTSICYPSLRAAKPELFRFEEEDMKKKISRVSSAPKQRKKKAVQTLLPPKGVPTQKIGTVCYPISKRPTPSLNSMVLGACSVGEKLVIKELVTVNPNLIFALTEAGFYVVIRHGKIDYVTIKDE